MEVAQDTSLRTLYLVLVAYYLHSLGTPPRNIEHHVRGLAKLHFKPGDRLHLPGLVLYNNADLTGRRFGRLTVLRRAERYTESKSKPAYWTCRCDCGNYRAIRGRSLRDGTTRSCGCLNREVAAVTAYNRFLKHGHAGNPIYGRENTPEYTTWRNLMGHYRKITYEKWHRFESFLADLGPKPPGAKLRRINRALGYRPGNVVWSTTRHEEREST